MRLFRLLAVLLLLVSAPGLVAQEYTLSLDDGTTVKGEFISASDSGIILRGEDGRLGRTITWFKLTQESLKKLEGHPKAGKYVELLIEPPPGQEPPLTPPPIELKEPPKPPRPAKVSLAAGIFTPAGLAMSLILLLANLYAAYEIALYRNRKVGMVIGVSAALPVLGPLVFLCIPTRRVEVVLQHVSPSGPLPTESAPLAETAEPLPEASAATPETESMPQPSFKSPDDPPEGETAAPPPNRMAIIDDDDEPASPGLKLAKRENIPQKADPNHHKNWKRGEQPINRRFFESNFSGFFKIAPPPPECDLRIILKTARGTYIGERISRIANDDLHLQKRAGDASNDIPVPFADILEVTVKHKDAVH